jgi:formate hydrogenlyase subunit 3/multisubunit Na+/H+ antiporter MnhD subunit
VKAHRRTGLLLGATRYGLPIAIALVGVVLIILGHASRSEVVDRNSVLSAAGVAVIIVAIIVWMLNWMYRLGSSSNQDREDEERAREYFDRTGRWPEDEPR